MDGYVRVSRVAGREGESFISPEVQRQKIAGWAELHDVEIVRWWEELDQSGRRRDRPMFQQALGRCEAGETGGIVVARLDRFARSAVDALEAIKRLNEAGARLVSVEDNFDGSTPMGRFAIGILTLIAELELDRITESWSTAVKAAVERGVHISATPPAGYRRDDSRRLVIVPEEAEVIREVFRRRANGASWTELADSLTASGVRSSKGSSAWSVTGVSSLVKNRVYLGEARSGRYVNPDGHEPIVTQAEFDAAQSQRTVLKPHDGSVASLAMLGGLVRCAGCGHTLKIAGGTVKKTGERYAIYYCTGRYASGPCPARATIRASYLDTYVEETVLAALQSESGFLAEAAQATEKLADAQRVLEQAEHELATYLQTDLITTVGQAAFLSGVQARQTRIDVARQQVDALRAESAFADELTSGDLLTAWPELTTPEKRTLLHGLLDQVTLRRDENRRHKTLAMPLTERVEIVLRGGIRLNGEASTQAR
jgi:DNA invertase Pin-like site-specific DNA recombinase